MANKCISINPHLIVVNSVEEILECLVLVHVDVVWTVHLVIGIKFTSSPQISHSVSRIGSNNPAPLKYLTFRIWIRYLFLKKN
jgi:hypothetical protein